MILWTELDNKCLTSPCKNGGSCIKAMTSLGYECACAREFKGTNCEGKEGASWWNIIYGNRLHVKMRSCTEIPGGLESLTTSKINFDDAYFLWLIPYVFLFFSTSPIHPCVFIDDVILWSCRTFRLRHKYVSKWRNVLWDRVWRSMYLSEWLLGR